jgi:hypothetical protein
MGMKAKRETVVAVIAAGVLLGGGGAAAAGIVEVIPGPGAGSPGHAQRPADDRVAGKFERLGGPIGPGGQPLPAVPLRGTMRFARSGHMAVTVRVGKTGVFSARLAPGQYRVSGRTPDILGEPGNIEATCSLPSPLTVRAGGTRHITVVCAVP